MNVRDIVKAILLAAVVLALDVAIAIGVVFAYAALFDPGHSGAYWRKAAVPIALVSTRIVGTALLFGAAWFFGRRRAGRNPYVFALVLVAAYTFWDFASVGFALEWSTMLALTLALKLAGVLAGAALARKA